MIEVDEVEAAMKKHRLKEGAHKAKAERKKRDQADVQYRSDSEKEEENPYDSDEAAYKA